MGNYSSTAVPSAFGYGSGESAERRRRREAFAADSRTSEVIHGSLAGLETLMATGSLTEAAAPSTAAGAEGRPSPLLARARFILWAMAATCLFFLATRAVLGGVPGWSHQAVRVGNFLALLALIAPLYGPKAEARAAGLVLAGVGLSMWCSAVVSYLEADPVNTSLGGIAITIGTSCFVPWTKRHQIALVVLCIGAVLANHAWLGVFGDPVQSITAGTAFLTFAATIFITHTLDRARVRYRRAEELRQRAELELREANEALERRVLERTVDVRAAIEELRAFSYSVSHDLRSPLRAINGMSELLEEEYADSLDEGALGYLARVKRAAGRMDRLIDALLSRSRVGQSELSRDDIDVVHLADMVLDDLRAGEPKRKIEWVRPESLPANADRTLVAVVLQQLLGNAWKFSRYNPEARIEFGAHERRGVPEYFVSDNGVGFPMEHAGKLFENFQRLHDDEYEGTGIGLATVQRIVARHGGAARIHSEPGCGTTVYFTLEPARDDAD